MNDRICNVKGVGGPLVVKLKSSIEISVGADFNLIHAPDGPLVEHWKLEVDNEYKLLTPITNLTNTAITWEFSYCSESAEVTVGWVEIEFWQDGILCPLTKLARWEFNNIPFCGSGANLKWQGSLEINLV